MLEAKLAAAKARAKVEEEAAAAAAVEAPAASTQARHARTTARSPHAAHQAQSPLATPSHWSQLALVLARWRRRRRLRRRPYRRYGTPHALHRTALCAAEWRRVSSGEPGELGADEVAPGELG